MELKPPNWGWYPTCVLETSKSKPWNQEETFIIQSMGILSTLYKVYINDIWSRQMLDQLMHLPVVSVDDYEQRIPLTNIVMQKCISLYEYIQIDRAI